MISKSSRKTRILLLGLYSKKYPSICETHGLSVLAGCLEDRLKNKIERLDILDLYNINSDKKDSILLDKISEFMPAIIGISVPYGSYSYLKEIFPKIKNLLKNNDHIVVFGGAIPTYIPEIILREIDGSALVVQGEGEDAIIKIVENWIDNKSWDDIPNISYISDGSFKSNNKILVDISRLPPPFRKHLCNSIKDKGQIFVETSRGCSWSKCSFCPRGLLDNRGLSNEYRYFSLNRIYYDLIQLKNIGIKDVTFSDEDFLGGYSDKSEKLINFLTKIIDENDLDLQFDVSMNIRSLFSLSWDGHQVARRKKEMIQLKNIGLRKVFLGLESGSISQLIRYNKGHSPDEALKAIQILKDIGVSIELGFIMFDPLCNLKEVEENINFLKNNGLAKYVSSLGSASELRIHMASKYLSMLQDKEHNLDHKLFDRDLDLNTLTYSPMYLNSDVYDIVRKVREWNSEIRPLYYPLKSLSRFGRSGSLGELIIPVKEIVEEMRSSYLDWLNAAVISKGTKGYIDDEIMLSIDNDILEYSEKILYIIDNCSISKNSDAIQSVIRSAMNFLDKRVN